MTNFLSDAYCKLELNLWPCTFNGLNVTATVRPQHFRHCFTKIVIVLTLAPVAHVNRGVSTQGLFGHFQVCACLQESGIALLRDYNA